jgi:carboxyl-terminal processing protease
MKRKAIINGVLGVLIAGSFMAGVFEPELRAQGGLPESIFSLRPGGDGRNLDPVNTYTKVLTLIHDNFNGAEPPTDLKLTYAAIRGMLNTLDDPYTRFLDPEEYKSLKEENEGEFEGIGAQLDGMPTRDGRIRIVKPIAGGPAFKAGVKRGDEIIKVDGASVVGLTVDDAVKKIRGKAGTVVHLTVMRSGDPKPVEIAITRAPVQYEIVENRMLDDKVTGYVSLAQFNEMSDKKIEAAVREMEGQGMKALVLDLRGNPGGLLDAAIDVSSRFIPSGRTVVWIVESGGEKEQRKTNSRIRYLADRFPFAVLVNRTSASASEIVSGAIKDNHAGMIVGNTTFGKGLVQTVVPLEDGSACMITTAKYLTPSQKDINRSREQRGGVEPDAVVDYTEEQYNKGEDPQLAKAVELLHQKIGFVAPGKPGGTSANAR